MSWSLFRHLLGIDIFLGVMMLVLLGNLLSLRRLGDFGPCRSFPFVSVLVPARNEERNIGDCVRSLLAQDYPDFEVLVLDDCSEDATLSLLQGLRESSCRLEVLRGEPLPVGWTGKNWACHQLSERARGELLLFTDADTRHSPSMLREAVAAMQALDLQMLSAFPREEVGTWSEKLLVPVFLWSVLSFLPLPLAHRLRHPFLSAALGQLMLFRADAYREMGGHAAVRGAVVDDLALGRLAKSHGLRWRFLDGAEHFSCRMYEGWREVVEGFSKNLFAVFDYNLPAFAFVWVWLLVVFCEPPVILVLAPFGLIGGKEAAAAGAAVGLALLHWALSLRALRFPARRALLYPLSVLGMVLLAARSLWQSFRGTAAWKGRELGRRTGGSRRRGGSRLDI